MSQADKETVVVALSGGVDSATAAAVLIEQGYRVVGITMRLFNAQGTESAAGGRCCGPRDIEDARRVCEHLDIPFYVANYEDRFNKDVVDDFVSEYIAGRTPNPCIRCNEKIKFTPLLARARALGAKKLATGHYARIQHGALWRGVDHDKDQSYFLFAMPSAEDILFPLGGMSKKEVRVRAHALGLPNAQKAESQEICFVPDGDQAGFVERRAQQIPQGGELVDVAGRVLGTHKGVHRYTVGQRKGLGAIGGGEPRFVVSVDALTRRVTVGTREQVKKDRMRLTHVRWRAEAPTKDVLAHVQVRHRHQAAPARVTATEDACADVWFEAPQEAIAPGQAAVFYSDDRVLGGGFIA